MAEVTEHRMPSGDTCVYRDSDHSYWQRRDPDKGTCSGRIAGMSTVAKGLGPDRTDPLVDWGSKLTCEGVSREIATILSLDDENIRSAFAWAESGESVWDTLKDEGLTWRQIREEAGFRGADCHAALEALAAGAVPIAQTPYDESVIAWWRLRCPEPLQVEQVVYSEKLNVAGRFDLRANVDGETWLLDLKTSKFIARGYHVQLAGYAHLTERCGVGPSARRIILQALPTGEPAVEIPCRARGEDFLTAVDAYERSKRIDREAAADRREREKAAA